MTKRLAKYPPKYFSQIKQPSYFIRFLSDFKSETD